MIMKKFFVTTPIYYVNDKPHVGSTYTAVAADVLARYHRSRGDRTLFSTGVDENSQKNVQAMEKSGETDLQAYLDRMSDTWKTTWEELGIVFDTFVRTTEPRHLAAVSRFWNAVKQSGDIYESVYEGLYCVGCEGFKTETETVDGKCPLHPNSELSPVKEKNYFFRASAYREALLNHLDENSQFVQPESRRNEIRNYITEHFTDFSISREAKQVSAGIPVPEDSNQRIYVWFDALINYLTVTGYGTDDKMCAEWWPADIHLIGKDILKFHCALWPAMLMSAAKNDPLLRDENGNPKLPTRVFAHGYFTINGQKISKSLGNAIDPRALVPTYGFDAVRYFMLREIPFGEDGDFSESRLTERYTHDLANTLGNLLQRTIAMSRKYFDGKVPPSFSHEAKYTFADEAGIRAIRNAVDTNMEACRFDLALEAIWSGVDGAHGLLHANKFIEDTQPFKLQKTDPTATGAILYSILEYLRIISLLLAPFMPDVSERMLKQLGQNTDSNLSWGGLKPGTELPEPVVLFKMLNN